MPGRVAQGHRPIGSTHHGDRRSQQTVVGTDENRLSAAHLACGVDLAELGELTDPNGLLPAVVSAAAVETDGLHAEVWWIDRFGNVQLNAGPEDLDDLAGDPAVDRFRVRIGDRVLPARRVTAFDQVDPGGLGLLVDSAGLVSLVMCRSSAAADLGLGPADPVVVEVSDGSSGGGVATAVSLGSRPGSTSPIDEPPGGRV